ncbi:MAG: leucine-rich repeat protein [Lachnospiraceae bacterium]|nr:leucine-rich repeat protein [Lachnospiraceae bacterium]
MEKRISFFQKMLCVVAAFILLFEVSGADISAASSVVAGGKWGNLNWKVSDTGRLTIYGSGAMKDGKSAEYGYPWLDKTLGVSAVYIENGVTSIAVRAFSGIDTLRYVSMPDSLREIGDGAFYGTGLESVTISKGVTTIGYGPFSACNKLSDILVESGSKNFRSIGGILYSADGTTLIQFPAKKGGTYSVDENTAIISKYAFEGSGIKNLTLPEKLRAIEYGAFSDCKNLTEVVIPEGVSIISEYSFNNCSNLTGITLPVTIRTIGAYAFNGDGPTLAVSYRGTENEWNSIYIGPYNGRLYTANKAYFNPNDPENILNDMNLKWLTWGDKSYWYEDGIRQGTFYDPKGVKSENGDVRGREIYDPASDAWYWLDSIYTGAKACNREVWMPYVYQDEENWSSEKREEIASMSGGMKDQVLAAMNKHNSTNGGGKWVRYDSDGRMIKGWYRVVDEEVSVYPSQEGNIYYYDPITGMMAKGWIRIGDALYHFSEVTGCLDGSGV